MTPWSSRAREALRKAPIVPRGRWADQSPTRALDDELYELTGRRGLPILDGVALGYFSTLDEAPRESEAGLRGSFIWGRGRSTLQLSRYDDRSWGNYDRGWRTEWREMVECLVLVEQFHGWIPPLNYDYVDRSLPRSQGKDLAERLALTSVPEVEHAGMDDEILYLSPWFYCRSIPALTRLLFAYKELGFCAAFSAPEIEPTFNADLESALHPQLSGEAFRFRDSSDLDITFQLDDQRAVRQVTSIQGCVAEILEARPSSAVRLRRPPPRIGSDNLQRALKDTMPLPPAPPPIPQAASPAMRGVLHEIGRVGRLFSPVTFSFMWLGLWRAEDLPRGPDRITDRFNIFRDNMRGVELYEPELEFVELIEWPLYRWREMQMVCIGSGPECEYYCDETGGIWMWDGGFIGDFDFCGGSLLHFLEACVAPNVPSVPDYGPALVIPMRAPGELPAHLGVPISPGRDDPRYRFYASSQWELWETNPTRGIPTISVRAASTADLIPVLAWAKEHWGTRKASLMNYSQMNPDIVRAAEDLGVLLVDAEEGGWRSEKFWQV